MPLHARALTKDAFVNESNIISTAFATTLNSFTRGVNKVQNAIYITINQPAKNMLTKPVDGMSKWTSETVPYQTASIFQALKSLLRI